jgi:hypothetical protein
MHSGTGYVKGIGRCGAGRWGSRDRGPGEQALVDGAHIRLAPVVPPANLGEYEGRIAAGTITAADFRGPLAGAPLSALLSAMRDGDTYVNVHTNAGPGELAGPGHFPAGEIRGQIRALGPKSN